VNKREKGMLPVSWSSLRYGTVLSRGYFTVPFLIRSFSGIGLVRFAGCFCFFLGRDEKIRASTGNFGRLQVHFSATCPVVLWQSLDVLFACQGYELERIGRRHSDPSEVGSRELAESISKEWGCLRERAE